MAKFEYKCVGIKTYRRDTEEFLNLLGEVGWELVCAYAKNNYYLILKRELK